MICAEKLAFLSIDTSVPLVDTVFRPPWIGTGSTKSTALLRVVRWWQGLHLSQFSHFWHKLLTLFFSSDCRTAHPCKTRKVWLKIDWSKSFFKWAVNGTGPSTWSEKLEKTIIPTKNCFQVGLRRARKSLFLGGRFPKMACSQITWPGGGDSPSWDELNGIWHRFVTKSNLKISVCETSEQRLCG